MVGFIGALSSSLCILILVFITLLLGYIDSMLPSQSLFKLSEASYRYPLDTYFVSDGIKESIEEVIENIKLEDGKKPNALKIGCTYGFDMNIEGANNIMVYNTIKLTSFNLPIDVMMYSSPKENTGQLNYCFIDIERENKNG